MKLNRTVLHEPFMNKMKKKKYHTVGTISKCNNKIVERGKMDNSNTQNMTVTLLT